MDNILDVSSFLRVVLPWDCPGFVSVHWIHPGTKGFAGRSCTSLEEMLRIIAELKDGVDIYFCMARHNGRRSSETAIGFRVIPFDIDIGPDDPKKYPDLVTASFWMFEFCKALHIPHPSIVVRSGGGIHVYWISNRTLSLAEWKVYAQALKREALRWGLLIDPAVTADAARVLRVPDTKNYKYDPPREVRVIGLWSFGKEYDFATEFSFANIGFGSVGVAVPQGPAFIQPEIQAEVVNANHPKAFREKIFGTSSRFAHLDADADAIGSGIEDYPPLALAPILKGCEWFRHAYETGGVGYTNPQWHLMILGCTWIEDGHELAHKLGNQYPTYTRAETNRQWQHKIQERQTKNIGWPRCSAIYEAGSRFCESCEHFKARKSPLHLALPNHDTMVEEEEDGNDEPKGEKLEGEPSDEEKALRLPDGFALNKDGLVSKWVASKRAHGVPTLVKLFLTKVSEPRSETDEKNQNGIGLTAQTDHVSKPPKPIFIPQSCLTDTPFRETLRTQGIMYVNNKQTRPLLDMLGMPWLDRLRAEQAARDISSMGWRIEDGQHAGFEYGGSLFRCDGTTERSRLPINDSFYQYYRPCGRKEPWLRAAKLLTDRLRPELDIIIAAAFGAPLAPFVGAFYGGMLSVWGTPGSGKSTAQQVAAAVWGNPKQTRESLDSTKKSVLNRLGRTKNLPAWWDDIQDERKQEQLFNAMFVATEGAEGGRLTADVRQRERLDWQTLLVFCSNASFCDYIVRKQPSTTAGLRRVLELEYNWQSNGPATGIGMIDELDASQAFDALVYNHGHVGLEYAQMLARQHGKVETLTKDTLKRFKARVKGNAEEFYWWGIAGILIAGAQLANELGAELRVDRMEHFLVETFENNRAQREDEGTEGGSEKNTDDALAMFMIHMLGNGHALSTDKMWESGDHVEPIKEPLQGRPLYVQVAMDSGLVRISKKQLRKFLIEHAMQTRSVIEGLKRFYGAKDNVRKTLGAGTTWAVMQEDLVEMSGRENAKLDDLLQRYGYGKEQKND